MNSQDIGFITFIALSITLIVTMAFFIWPMLWIEDNAKDNFCRQKGFEGRVIVETVRLCGDMKNYQIIRQSSKGVSCDWGFYKVYNCRWKEDPQMPEIVEVGS